MKQTPDRICLECEFCANSWNYNVENIPGTIQSWDIKHRIAFNWQLSLVNVMSWSWKHLAIMLCYLSSTIDIQRGWGKSTPMQRWHMALPAEALKASAFQHGGRGQALGDWGQAVLGSMGGCLRQKRWSSCFITSSGEEAVRPAVSQTDKALQKLGLIFWTLDWQSKWAPAQHSQACSSHAALCSLCAFPGASVFPALVLPFSVSQCSWTLCLTLKITFPCFPFYFRATCYWRKKELLLGEVLL